MKRFRYLSTALLVAAPVFLGGCGSSYMAKQPFKTDKVNMWDVDLYYRYTKNPDANAKTSGTVYKGGYFWDAYDNEADIVKKKLIRNQIMYELMLVVDDNYSKYKEHLRNDTALKHAWADIISQGLSMTGTIVNGGNATRIISAVNLGWAGSNQSFDKYILAGNLMEAIIKSMDAGRNEVAAKIYKSMTSEVSDYPLTAGLKDIGEYNAKGALVEALTSLANQATTQALTTDTAKNDAKLVLEGVQSTDEQNQQLQKNLNIQLEKLKKNTKNNKKKMELKKIETNIKSLKD
jgi:hypothetical protein